MKEAQLNTDIVPFIPLKDIKPENSIGVLRRNEKAFIVNSNFENPTFHLTPIDGINDGNAFYIPGDSGNFTFNNRNCMIITLIKEGHHVFVFDTPQELFAWLLK
jgi:hypothetical protein